MVIYEKTAILEIFVYKNFTLHFVYIGYNTGVIKKKYFFTKKRSKKG